MTDTTEQQAVTVAQEAAIVAVTQADRDAVQAFHRKMLDRLMSDVKSQRPKLGDDEGDAGTLVQAFARHRLASVSSASAEGIEACIALCDRMENDESLPDQAVYAAWNLKVGMLHLLKRASASPEPVPATNQAGEVDVAIRIAVWNACRDRGMSQDGATMLVRKVMAEPVLTAALATQPATSQEGEVTQSDKDCLVSVAASLACGAQSLAAQQIANYRARHVLAATPTPPTLSEDLRTLVEALEPFAAACNITTAEDSESLYDSLAAEKLTWRDLRRARAVYNARGGA